MMQISDRMVLRIPSDLNPDGALPVFTEKPWEWVAACISLFVKHRQLIAVYELHPRRMVKRPEVTIVEHSMVEYLSLAKKAVASGNLFFLINAPLQDVAVRLVTIGYEIIVSVQLERDGHFLEEYINFTSAIEAMLLTDPGVVCCFSHDAEYVYLYSN